MSPMMCSADVLTLHLIFKTVPFARFDLLSLFYVVTYFFFYNICVAIYMSISTKCDKADKST